MSRFWQRGAGSTEAQFVHFGHLSGRLAPPSKQVLTKICLNYASNYNFICGGVVFITIGSLCIYCIMHWSGAWAAECMC